MIRLSQIPIHFLLKKINFEKILPKFILNYRQKLFINDMLIDFKRYNLTEVQKRDMIKSYETSYLFSWIHQVKMKSKCIYLIKFEKRVCLCSAISKL